MNFIEIASLVSSLMALALGIIAIWLSVVFYKMSSEISESTKEAAKGIGASVDRLEKVFDRLYSDTFSMMKDTVSDMRKHIWPEEVKSDETMVEESEKKADEKVNALKKGIDSDIARLLKKQKITNNKVNSIREELRDLVNRVISESRKAEIEAREETTRGLIMQELRLLKRERTEVTHIQAGYLVDILSEKIPPEIIKRELRKMKDDGIIFWEDKYLMPKSRIEIPKHF